MEYFVVLVLFGAVTAVVAKNKGRSAFGWFLIGVLLGPIGLILALVVSKNLAAIEHEALSSGAAKKCPFCAELIKQEAIVCRFCGRELVNSTAATKSGGARVSDTELQASGVNLNEVRRLVALHLGNPKMSIDDKKVLLTLVGGDFRWLDSYGHCTASFMGEVREFPTGKEFSDWFRSTVLPTLRSTNE